jgi:hypothetical protein
MTPIIASIVPIGASEPEQFNGLLFTWRGMYYINYKTKGDSSTLIPLDTTHDKPGTLITPGGAPLYEKDAVTAPKVEVKLA